MPWGVIKLQVTGTLYVPYNNMARIIWSKKQEKKEYERMSILYRTFECDPRVIQINQSSSKVGMCNIMWMKRDMGRPDFLKITVDCIYS